MQLLDFLVSPAHAQAAPAPQGGGLLGLLFPIILIVAFYFLMIRPQTKRAKEHKAMVEALKKGDEVVTGGGLLGRISDVDENFVRLEVADGVQVRIQKQAVGSLMPKGTYKSADKATDKLSKS
ncbi:MAG: preprotein translocase subunit YajC [Candidatus Competibacteraceae bacterium]|nr:preprotein translocase subunit YajC [Candidatus Competibacteraceae bacterium]